MPVVPDGPAPERVSEILAARYELTAEQLVQLPLGQGTVNYRATCAEREVFVKCYPQTADLEAERAAIGLAELAREHGIRVPEVLRARDGATLEDSAGVPVSVWEWMPGRVATTGLTAAQHAQVGTALGEIHALFAPLPQSKEPAAQSERWYRMDAADLSVRIDRLQQLIAEREAEGVADEFDAQAAVSLAERKQVLPRIPELLRELPQLNSQVLHGDYTLVNILFTGEQLSAVLDFRPPSPFLIAYDLGRIAFSPDTVTDDPDWLNAARVLIEAYLAANPTVPAADVLACGRVALLQLLKSLYGVKEHYLGGGLIQADLDRFWFKRHQTVQSLLSGLAETDAMLRGLTAAAAGS